MEGWIKIHRKLLDNPIIMKDSDYLSVWIYLLLNATHKDYDVMFKGKRTTLKKGQLITGRKVIAENLKINENKVQRILKSFENEQQIEQQTNNQNRLISILNWEEYQKNEQQIEQQMNNERTTDEQQMNTNKNVKNIKNNKNVVVEYGGRADDIQTILDYYNKNIAPVTEYVLEMLQSYIAEGMSCEVILNAMQIEVKENAKLLEEKKEPIKTPFKYIKAILNNWSKRGVKTMSDLEHKSSETDIDRLIDEVIGGENGQS